MASDMQNAPLFLHGRSAALDVPAAAQGLVIFAGGCAQADAQHRRIAAALQQAEIATLVPAAAERGRPFDIAALEQWLRDAADWAHDNASTASLPIGYFGAGREAAAALEAASGQDRIAAVVSQGGRLDLAEAALAAVRAPTLLIVGALDAEVVALNQQALARLGGEKALSIVPGAGCLFDEPGALDEVAWLAATWFRRRFTLADSAESLHP